jgi:hypothetical protein
MSKAIASSIKDFAFDTLLMRAIVEEKENDGEGTEYDPLGGTGFEPVHDPTPSSSHPPHAMASNRPGSFTHAFTTLPPLSNTSPTGTTRSLDDSSDDSEPASDANPSTSGPCKRKRKTKSKISYKKLMFKKRWAADGQIAKGDIEVKVRPGMGKRHTSSPTPINALLFNLDTKTPAKTGYIGVHDTKTSKRIYELSKMVGVGSRFNFNLVEWDGKHVHPLFHLYLPLHDAGYRARLSIK